MISFNLDDGWDSGYQKALPIFDAAGIDTTMCITSNHLEYEGFVTPAELADATSRGHEVCGHAREHNDLTLLSEADMEAEIHGGKADLAARGFESTTFAYPFGAVNDAVKQEVKDAGFTSARGVEEGYNDKNTDPYVLYSWNASPMSFEQAKAIIDEAAANGKWVIFLFHKVDEAGDDDSISSAVLQQIVDYVGTTSIEVVTSSEGAARLGTIE